MYIKIKGNPKISWEIMNNFINWSKNQNIMINLILFVGIEMLGDNDHIIYDKFNDFFL